MAATPVWLWPPGMAEPCLAATLAVGASGGVWHFAPDFVGAGTPSPDPIRLPLGRGTRPIHFPGHDGLAGVVLAMDVSAGQGRTSCASIETLLATSVHFGVPTEAAAQWLLATAADVANHWPDLLRASVLETGTVRAAQVIEDCQPAFAFAHWVAEHPGLVEQHAATQKLKSAKRRR